MWLLSTSRMAATPVSYTHLDVYKRQRMGRAEELCGTIQYLISDASSFVTGTVAVVDGGFNAFAM